jgi:flagellar assembly factor FliW
MNMRIEGTRFGELEIDAARVITLESGLIGFPEETRFVLLMPAKGRSVAWLQSLMTPALAFPVLSGDAIRPAYSALELEGLARNAAIEPDALSVFVIVAARPRERRMVANLLAPIVVDAASQRGAQVVLDAKAYSAATPIAALG